MRAAGAIARLDQALAGHPLRPAFLYRARLDAVRRQADADGQRIDPWHLAALLEGLRLRMDPALRIVDRGVIFAAAGHAFGLYQWLTAPDFDQQGAVQQAAADLAVAGDVTPLIAAASWLHGWLERGGDRAPARAALVRHWTRHRLLRTPVPLTGAAALRPDTPWAIDAWLPAFLTALAEEADDWLQLLMDPGARLVRRPSCGPRPAQHLARRPRDRCHGRGATGFRHLARRRPGHGGEQRRDAARGLLCGGDRRRGDPPGERRLFGLLAWRRCASRWRRPPAGAGTRPGAAAGPPTWRRGDGTAAAAAAHPVERRAFDYSDLEHWMAHADGDPRHAARARQAGAGSDAGDRAFKIIRRCSRRSRWTIRRIAGRPMTACKSMARSKSPG